LYQLSIVKQVYLALLEVKFVELIASMLIDEISINSDAVIGEKVVRHLFRDETLPMAKLYNSVEQISIKIDNLQSICYVLFLLLLCFGNHFRSGLWLHDVRLLDFA
jgi:hypothetical protein